MLGFEEGLENVSFDDRIAILYYLKNRVGYEDIWEDRLYKMYFET